MSWPCPRPTSVCTQGCPIESLRDPFGRCSLSDAKQSDSNRTLFAIRFQSNSFCDVLRCPCRHYALYPTAVSAQRGATTLPDARRSARQPIGKLRRCPISNHLVITSQRATNGTRRSAKGRDIQTPSPKGPPIPARLCCRSSFLTSQPEMLAVLTPRTSAPHLSAHRARASHKKQDMEGSDCDVLGNGDEARSQGTLY